MEAREGPGPSRVSVLCRPPLSRSARGASAALAEIFLAFPTLTILCDVSHKHLGAFSGAKKAFGHLEPRRKTLFLLPNLPFNGFWV
eukprot:scaffold521_cov226-Pinguiococcus_pyrenoidosus.AAC.2